MSADISSMPISLQKHPGDTARIVTPLEAAESRLSILFISHYSGRNGAPLILLGLLKWLRQNTNINLTILIRQPGEMDEEYAAVASIMQLPRLGRIAAGIRRRLNGGEQSVREKEDEMLRDTVARLKPDLIYSNTITNTRELLTLAPLGIPTLCHVHELEYWIRYELGIEKAKATVPGTSRFIAAGQAVKQFLETGVGVSADKIDVVQEFPYTPVQAGPNRDEVRIAMRAKLGVNEDSCVIGACGMVDWRKGADLFVAVATAVIARAARRKVKFVWIGGPVSGKVFDQLQFDIAHAGLGDVISFVGPQKSLVEYYPAVDIFLLPSREDPCPLVMLEAAAHELPIVCFQNSGGAPEFVQDDAGIAVPYLDVVAMAGAVSALQDNPEMRARMGKCGRLRAETRHNPETQCTALFDAIVRAAPHFQHSLKN